jgi:ABC-2 type transport system ATP-binding protein
MNNIAINVSALGKSFNNKIVVNNVDICMPKGQVWGFLGPNGSGKTTTIRMLCGLLKPSKGEGSCLGFDIKTQAEQIKLQTGYMTQKFSFWNDLTIRENLAFVARIYNLPNRNIVVENTLATLGLTERQHQLAGNLSGGWKQRLALAAVTMHQPKLLLLDEPTAGVDPQARRDFWDNIHRLASEGMTVLVSTHYMDEAERCDKIVYLAHGNVITQGSVAEVIAKTNLITYRATGENIRDLAQLIKKQPGVEHSGYFGAALHVSGRNEQLLKQTVNQFKTNKIQWQQVPTSLEDTFIALMSEAGIDNRQY